MKVWISTDYGSSNISEFKNYEEKKEFFKKRTDPEMIKLIELKEKLLSDIKDLKLSNIYETLGLKKIYDENGNMICKTNEYTNEIIQKLFEKMKEYSISPCNFVGLKVISVPSQKRIKFDEYDGSEYIEIYNDMDWFLV